MGLATAEVDDFLWRAQEASAPGGLTREEFEGILKTGIVTFFTYKSRSARTVVGVQVDGTTAVFRVFYREGPKMGLMKDARELMKRVVGRLKEYGATEMVAAVRVDNPRIKGLVRLYERLGFDMNEVWMRSGL